MDIGGEFTFLWPVDYQLMSHEYSPERSVLQIPLRVTCCIACLAHLRWTRDVWGSKSLSLYTRSENQKSEICHHR